MVRISKKDKIFLASVFLIEVVLAFFIKIDMSTIAEPPAKLLTLFGWKIPFNGINIATVVNTWVIMAFLIWCAFLVSRRLTPIPSRLQSLFEMYIEAFDKLCSEVLDDKRGRKYMPMVSTLFIFILLSNWIGVVPSFWRLFEGLPHWMKIEEPTKDLNTTLGFGIMCFFVAHVSGIYYKGIGSYLAEFFEPMIVIGKVRIPNLFMGILNIVGEFGKAISHSFRLFGNILGGSIIIIVISNLTKYIGLPVLLNSFFGIFVGAIQAFVFAMLALVYVSLMVNE